MTVTIKLPDGEPGEAVPVSGTKVFTHDGHEIDGVSRISLNWRADEIAQATFEIHLDAGTTLENVHALLGTETLEQIAAMHGYKLTPIGDTE